MKSIRQCPGPTKGNKIFTTASCGAVISLFCCSMPCCFSAQAGLLFSLEPLSSMQMENRAAEGLPSWEAGILWFQIPSAAYFINPLTLFLLLRRLIAVPARAQMSVKSSVVGPNKAPPRRIHIGIANRQVEERESTWKAGIIMSWPPICFAPTLVVLDDVFRDFILWLAPFSAPSSVAIFLVAHWYRLTSWSTGVGLVLRCPSTDWDWQKQEKVNKWQASFWRSLIQKER